MIYKEGFDVPPLALPNAVSFPYLLTLVAFERKAPQLSLSGHPPILVCILSLLCFILSTMESYGISIF